MNKYKRGRRLTLVGLVRELEARHYVYLGHPTSLSKSHLLHPGWSRSMQFRTLSCLASKHRGFYKAIETNKKEK